MVYKPPITDKAVMRMIAERDESLARDSVGKDLRELSRELSALPYVIKMISERDRRLASYKLR